MKKSLIIINALLFLLGFIALGDDDTKMTITKPCVTITGADSLVSERGYHRIQSLDDWAEVWQKHSGQNGKNYKNFDNRYDTHYNKLGLPLVDFEHYMIIAIFQGNSFNNAGLNVNSVIEKDDHITVRFENKSYSTAGADGGGEKVTVYGFFVVARSNKTVVLEEKVIRLRDGQAFDPRKSKSDLYTSDWQERFKFEEAKEK